MHYSCRNLKRFYENCFILTISFQDFNVLNNIPARIALSSQCFFNAQNVSDTFLSFLLQNCNNNLAVDSKPSISRQFSINIKILFTKIETAT